MTRLEWAALIADEIMSGDVDTEKQFDKPEIDMEPYTSDYGIIFEDFCEALFDWMSDVGDSLDDEWQDFMDDYYYPALHTVDNMRDNKANRRCERIIKAHKMA